MRSTEIKGFLFGILAAFSYAGMAVFVKLAKPVPNETLVFFRSLISFAFLLPFFLRHRVGLKTSHPYLYAVRCLAGIAALYCFFYAAKNLYLPKAVLLINTAPLFMPLVVVIWLKLKIPQKRFFGSVLGFFGVLLILRPGSSFFQPAGLIGLASGLFLSIALVALRRLSKTEPTLRIIFYFFASSCIVAFFPMLYAWEPIVDPIMWVYMGFMGFAAYLYQFFITKAYTHAPATKVSTLGYLAVVFSGFFDWLLWSGIPSFMMIVGVVLVVGGGVIVLLDNKEAIPFKKR